MSAVVVAVVLNWRDAPSTRACIASLLSEKGVTSVVVVDNESDGHLRDVQNARVTLLEQQENLGFSRGVNVGLRHALEHGAEAAFVINNDAEVQPGCVDVLIQAWTRERDHVGLVAPVVLNPDHSPQSTGGHFRSLDASTRDLGAGDRINYLTWACVLIPRRTLETVGLLDENYFMYWEDVDYGLRVLDAGLSLVVVDGAHVIHAKSKSHGRAGVIIDRYSARGLTLLCHKRGGIARYVGLPYRLGGRLLSRVPRGRRAVAAVLNGWRDGVRLARRRA